MAVSNSWRERWALLERLLFLLWGLDAQERNGPRVLVER
jgi:hypothetical protein